MLKLLRSLFSASSTAAADESPVSLSESPPSELRVPDAEGFPISTHISIVEELPYLDWAAVTRWLATVDGGDRQASAWAECELAWLQHLRLALGEGYTLLHQGDALLLSSLEPRVARATLEYMCTALRRIERVLDGIAKVPEWGKDIMIVFDDDESYYRYVAHYYPEGEFAGSGGMYVSAGCGHFITMKADLHTIEPVIVHEMTHGCLCHLPIPAWLNEGIAVNTERRIVQVPSSLYSPIEMHGKHLRYWDECRIQEFWSGKSFHRTDDGNLLSYDLAQKIVEQFASNWGIFRAFVLSAHVADGGAAAAVEHFGLNLGEVAAAVVGCDFTENWSPSPKSWPAEFQGQVPGTLYSIPTKASCGQTADVLANPHKCTYGTHFT